MATIVGILSDTHGRAAAARQAVAAMIAQGAEVLIHLGDIGDESVIDELVGHAAHVVFGNCDFDEKCSRGMPVHSTSRFTTRRGA